MYPCYSFTHMDWIFIERIPREGEPYTGEENREEVQYLRELAHAFVQERRGNKMEGESPKEYVLIVEFLRWLKGQPDRQEISYNPGSIRPTKDAHQVSNNG